MNFVKPSQRKTNSQVYCGYRPDNWRVMFLIYIFFFYRECVRLVDAYPRDVVFYDPGLVRARLIHHLYCV